MPKGRLRIYKSRWHLAITLGTIIVPFLFLLVFSRLTDIAFSTLTSDIAISMARLALAYIIAVSLGWSSAILFYKGKRSTMALPIFDVLQSFPTFAILPLVTYFWGPSNLTIVSFLVITVIWPIIFSVVSSLRLMKTDWVEAVEISGLSGFQYLRYFLWPVSIPGLITGSIVGLGEGWEAIIATEIIVGAKLGLGSFFRVFSQNVTITTLGVLGFLIIIFAINKLVWLPLLDWSHNKMEE